jgi:hypothetical protein
MQPEHVYRISPWRRAVLWCVLGPFAAAGLGLWAIGADAQTRTAGAVVVAVMAACLAAWHWLSARTALVLTPAGVQLRQLGMNLDAAWSDIGALSLVRGREGFVLDAPIVGAGAARLAALRGIGAYGVPLYDGEQRALMLERRFIPIEAFAWHAYHGTLADDVARLAPHVRIGTASHGAQSPADETPRVVLWTVLLVALTAGVGAAFLSAGSQSLIETVLQSIVAPVVTVRAGLAAWNALRARALLVGTLFGALTLVTGAWMLVVLVEIVSLLDW